MRISHLSIANYRSIEKLELDLPQFCALVGANNAGKSNILSALHRLLSRDWISVAAFSESDVFGHDPARDIVIECTFDPPIPYTEFKYAAPVQVHRLRFEYARYKKGEKKGLRRLDQSCRDANGKPLTVLARAPKAGEAQAFKPLLGIPPEVREQTPLIFIGTDRSLLDQLPSAKNSMLRQLLADIDDDLRRPDNLIRVRGPSGQEGDVPRIVRFQQLMEAVLEVLRTKDFESLESSLKANALRQLGFDPVREADRLDLHFAAFDTLDFFRTLELRVREGSLEIDATEQGQGVQNAIVLAILQAFEERRKSGAILLIEEPEMFLHPQMQRSLYRTLRGIGGANQLIYVTHSPHFVSVPEYEDVVRVFRGRSGTEARCTTLPSSARLRSKLIKELDPERGELFFASRVLLVEGDTEKMAIPVYGRRMGVDFDRLGVTVVEVGGKRSLNDFLDIVESFGVPCGVLYDEDASDFREDREGEREFNSYLDARGADGPSVRIWRMRKDYEAELRAALGNDEYERQCNMHPRATKATRARLIALDESTAIPTVLFEVIRWLSEGGSRPPTAT